MKERKRNAAHLLAGSTGLYNVILTGNAGSRKVLLVGIYSLSLFFLWAMFCQHNAKNAVK
jgi:hypothetical protein